MHIVEVIPADLHFMTMFKSKEVKLLKTILDNMVFNCDASNPLHVEANEYLHKLFYPTIEKAEEEYCKEEYVDDGLTSDTK